MRCPLCDGDGKPAFEAKGYPVLDCRSCGHRFACIDADELHVATHYGDAYFTGGGAGYTDYAAEGRLLRRRGLYYSAKLVAHTEPGVMLDVGAAAGFILRGFIDAGWSGIGIEPNASMAEYGRRELGLEMRTGSFEAFDADPGSFDLVSMIQVAAHFYDPAGAFANARRLLRPGGMLLIETWDRDSLTARALGRHWHEYSPPSVLHWFSRDSLTEYLENNGFVRIDGGRPVKKISGGHVRSLLRYRLGDNPLLRLVPERITFPYPAEDLFWALYRRD